jgi:hypothetical protein
MTTFSSRPRFPSGSGDGHRRQDPSPRIEGLRNLHRAEGWLIALTGAAVLWALIIGVATRMASLLG